MDAFEALGIARAWRVPPDLVRAAQRRLCATFHPDRFADPAARADAQVRVARANQAAAALLDPLGCAQALLDALAPMPRPAEPRPESAFLMAMMEIRERVDGEGVTAVEPELAALQARAEADAERFFGALEAGDASAWVSAAEAVGRLRAVARARGQAAP
jgi:DnaJ-domain-containing protein 1